MPHRGKDQLESIRDDLACLNCDYSLRGLPGEVVTCPECGTTFDVAHLAMRRWLGPWQNAPGFSKILHPIAWLSFSALPGFALYVMAMEDRASPILVLGWSAASFGIWCGLLASLRTAMPDGRAIHLALFAHVLLVGYLACVYGIIALMVQAFTAGSMVMMIIQVAMAGVLVPVLIFCRKGERYIAERCIRHHLAREATRATIAA